MMLRNVDREKRKQTILQKLPAMNMDYYETYLTNSNPKIFDLYLQSASTRDEKAGSR